MEQSLPEQQSIMPEIPIQPQLPQITLKQHRLLIGITGVIVLLAIVSGAFYIGTQQNKLVNQNGQRQTPIESPSTLSPTPKTILLAGITWMK